MHPMFMPDEDIEEFDGTMMMEVGNGAFEKNVSQHDFKILYTVP
jgi:hypothetical protein